MEEIKMMDIPVPSGYNDDITKHTPEYVYGKNMKDHIVNSVFNEWCQWYFPNGMKEKIEDEQLYLVWYHFKDASDPQNLSCSYKVYYIEKVPKDIQEALELKQEYEEILKKYLGKYER
jgi:hypothetical protein